MQKTVLVYRSVLLPHSETFIKEQMLAFKAWRGVLVGRRLLGQLPLDGLDVIALEPAHPGTITRVASKLRRQFGVAPRIDALQREAPDLLHVHFGTDALEALPIAVALGIPLLVTLHGYDINIHRDWWEAGYGGWDMRRYPKRLLALAHRPFVRFIAVSEAIRKQAIAYGIPAVKITTRHIGIDTCRFTPAPVPVGARAPRILFVGRLIENKGCQYLIEAMAHVRARVPNAKAIVIGDGPMRECLERQARECIANVEFRGRQPHSEVRRELGLARTVCVPSVTIESGASEGLPTVIPEAQSCGVPVVTSARGGATEGIIHGETGFAFKERDADALAAHICTVLTDDGLATRLGLAARRFALDNFDIRKCTAALEDVYESIVPAPLSRPDARALLTNVPAT
jgi:glucosyltransferase